MKAIKLFGIGQYGKSKNVTAQQRLNCYIEVQPGDDRSVATIYGTPGLDLFINLGTSPIRGLYQRGDYIYVVYESTFYEINNAGVATSRGTIGTTIGRCYMSDNGTQLMLTDGALSYIYNFTSHAFTQIVSAGFLGAGTVTWQDGYFITSVPSTQRFQISAINDGLTWDALDFASAESNPDTIVSVFSANSTLYLFGLTSTEFWTNGGSIDFPYSRVSGGAIEWGCAAVESIVKYDNSVAFIAKNRMGQVIIAKMNGYSPQRISTPELEHVINNYPAVSDATAMSYMLGGHPMLVLSFPSGDATWMYDGLTNEWSMLKGHNLNRHRANIGVNYIEKTIVSDYANGNLYRFNPLSYTDNGDPIVMEVITRHISQDNSRLFIDSLQLDIEAGVGLSTGQGSNPQIMLSISKDGGHTFGIEQWVSMGAIGEYQARAIWRRLGMARDWVFKFRITDPVKRVILGATASIKQGTS